MPESYHKVIKQDGFFICVNTGEKHLIELREKLYEEITKAEFDPVKNMGDDFELVDHQQVSYQNTLSSQQQIQDLLLMTPHNWRTKADKKEALASLEELTVTIDAQIHIFKAKAKAIVEVEVIAEPETKPKTSGSINPWGKTTIEAPTELPITPITELSIETPTEIPAETITEIPVVIPVEIPDAIETQSSTGTSTSPWGKAKEEVPTAAKGKINPWSKD
jgi:23S rRNA (guanine745-N1)-methyltransferase